MNKAISLLGWIFKIEKAVYDGVMKKAREYMQQGHSSDYAHAQAMYDFGQIDHDEYMNIKRASKNWH